MNNKELIKIIEDTRTVLSAALLALRKPEHNKKNYQKKKAGSIGSFTMQLRKARINEPIHIPPIWYGSVCNHLKKYNKLHKFHIDTENNFTKLEDWNDPKLNDV